MEAEKYQLFIKQKREKQEKLAEERAGLPRPVLWYRPEIPGFGTGKSTRLGDRDGDGQLEILLVQNVRRIS
ncbi:MAG: hypothetical protein FH762_05310 [Firmicutes bacterium]|nr:hypothetical protein [Bacillota bacterium]